MIHKPWTMKCPECRHIFRPHAMMPKKRLVLREEAFGTIKTLKRLEPTNPSVRFDRMDDFLSIMKTGKVSTV